MRLSPLSRFQKPRLNVCMPPKPLIFREIKRIRGFIHFSIEDGTLLLMLILAVETSCDETSVAVVRDGTEVLCNIIATQQKDFASTGGVIPEQAARAQVELILPTLHRALEEAKITKDNLDAIAVTKGPGLLVSLVVGTTVARTVASIWAKPLIGVHHTLGHLSSTWLMNNDQSPLRGTVTNDQSAPVFPILTLSASGGHTDLWYRTSHTKGILLGRTRDDAAGEEFDKGAAMLGLPYPGGPSISKEAVQGDKDAFEFPCPLQGDSTFDFSYSGLKTALKYTLRDTTDWQSKIPDLAASYQHAICIHLVSRAKRAMEKYPDSKEVHIVGGVSANTHLRSLLEEMSGTTTIRWPTKISYCTDNAAMIGSAAEYMAQEMGDKAYEPFETVASLPLEETITA